MRRVHLVLLCFLIVAGIAAPAAVAMDKFKKAFADKYVQPANDQEFTKLVRTTGCNVCHVRGQEKDVRNAYGEELAKLIQGSAQQRMDAAEEAGGNASAAEMAKLLKELEAAFPKVEAMKSPAGPTYGERLKEHKLPAP